LGMIKYHLLVLIREPANMFFGLALPFLNLFLISGNIEGEMGYLLDFGLPMFIIIAALVLCFTDSALSHAYSRQIKFLRKLRMTPVKPATYVATGILSRLVVILLFVATFLTFTTVFFGATIGNRNWLVFGGIVILVFAMFYFISMFLANVFKSAKTSQNMLNIIFWGFLLLGNLFVPLEAMPDILQTITQNTPTIFAANLIQSAWFGSGVFTGHNFIVVLAVTAVFGLLSIKFFKYE